MAGRLTGAFRAATLTSLQTSFLSAASLADKVAATQALSQFYRAARRLHISENVFNKRARPSGDRLSVMAHMRNRAQFAAMREFSAAKELLLDISPALGRSIVRLVAQGAGPAAPQPPQSSAGKPNL